MMACCVAVGCSNRSDRKDLSFYRFPKDPDRRDKWIAAVKRKDWSPTDYSRLCSRHFISGEKSNNPLSPDYVPSLFVFTKSKSPEKKAKKRRAETVEKDSDVKRNNQDLNERLTAATVLLNLSMAAAPADSSDLKQQVDLQEEDSDPPGQDEEHPDVEAQSDTTEPESVECKLNSEQSQTEDFDDHNYCVSSAVCDKGTQYNKEPLYRDLLRTDALCRLHTGLPLITFNRLTEHLLPLNDRVFELDPMDQLLMTLMTLKLNLLQEYLAERFCVRPSSVSKILAHWIDLMETHMESFIPWLHREELAETTPQCFKEHYPGTTCIIDFSEIRLKTYQRLGCREESYRYNDEITVKFAVAFAPCGLIMFISAAYGGECSDWFITSDSGLLDLLHPTDEVMADQSFMIRDLLNEKGVKLIVPTFKKRSISLSEDDTTHDTCIEDIRVHLERMVCRLKQFKILSESIPSSLVSKVDQILRICAALCNLQEENFCDELE